MAPKNTMEKLRLPQNTETALVAEVLPTDPYTAGVLVKLKIEDSELEGTEFKSIMTTSQLDYLGRFFLRKAEEVRLMNIAK